MRRLRCLLAMLISFPAFFVDAQAGDAVGTVQEVHMGPLYGTRVFLKIAGTIDMGDCHTNHFHFVFDSAVAGGKELLSASLAAKTSQSTVRVNGFDTCNLYAGVEDLRWLTLE
jgi:hypothetical protein